MAGQQDPSAEPAPAGTAGTGPAGGGAPSRPTHTPRRPPTHRAHGDGRGTSAPGALDTTAASSDPAPADPARPAAPSRPAAPATPASSAKPAKKPRDPLLDNARAILIALVVVGHTIESNDNANLDILYTWIYSFHMPAFVAISGFLCRSYRNEPRQISRLLTGMLLPYLIFQVIHSVESDLLDGDPITVTLWHPAWTLWFLLALTFWRVFSPVLRSLRYPLVFAVAISVLAPLEADLDTVLTWGRVLSFLPFFVMGLMCTPEMLARIRDVRWGRAIGAAAFACAFVVAVLTHDKFSNDIFTMSRSFSENDMGNIYGIVTRVLVLICGTILTIALVMVAPRRHHWFTALGVESLTIYLIHPLLLQVPRNLGWFDTMTSNLDAVMLVVGALLLVLILSRPPIVKVLSWITSPPVGRWLVKEEPQPRAAAGSGAR
ncbi:acyltransferase family protein [Brachybacterium subflavum]|uniref:acyltransferase family protein n=1 Tax=Brachybacterium subflavum TaxID=2585206 RepID=UPI001D0CF32E|nr:acyltransferase family protein [Brachybacterium subflavum]